jgi:hypothetical protein
VHGAKLILGSQAGRLQKFAARDCLLVDLARQFVMSVEVVRGEEGEGALQRHEGASDLLEDYNGGELRDGWMFIGAVYAESLGGRHVCEDCSDFVMVGAAEVGPKLERMVERLTRERPSFCPSPLVYRALLRVLLFCVQAAPKGEQAPGTAEWVCWSPEQLVSCPPTRGLRTHCDASLC